MSAAFLPLPALAQCLLYASEASDRGRDLLILDQNTAAATVVGDIGGETTGLAFHPSTSVLYGSTARIQLGPQNFDPGDLITIDVATGAGTQVGSFGLADISGEEGPTLADIAFDPVTGILYGWRARRFGDLYTVNLTTGAATKVGESGLDLEGGQGLTFGAGNRLYLAGEGAQGLLRTIDKNTGLPIDAVQLTGYPDNSNIGALAFDGTHIYGVTVGDEDLIRIDPVTGQITTIGFIDRPVDGLAFLCPLVSAPAPALQLPGLLLLVALLLALAPVLPRRRAY